MIKNKKIKCYNKMKIRKELFSEPLFTKTYKESFKGRLTDRIIYTIKKFKKIVNSLKFPFLGEKIIFNKGKTEKLLNYQYYNTSYRACFKISSNNIPNNSVKINYKNNWSIVNNYLKERKNMNRELGIKKILEIKLNISNNII